MAVGATPGDRVRETFAIGLGDIAKLAPRLGIVKEHMVARHSQAVHRDEWLDAANPRQQLRSVGDWVEQGPWQLERRRTPFDETSDVGEHIGKEDVLAAKDIAFADSATLERGDMTGRDVIDMREIE